MNEITPEHYIEMGVDPALAGLSLDELLERQRRLEERIRKNRDCSGIEHDHPATSIVPSYLSAVVASTVEVSLSNETITMLTNDV